MQDSYVIWGQVQKWLALRCVDCYPCFNHTRVPDIDTSLDGAKPHWDGQPRLSVELDLAQQSLSQLVAVTSLNQQLSPNCKFLGCELIRTTAYHRKCTPCTRIDRSVCDCETVRHNHARMHTRAPPAVLAFLLTRSRSLIFYFPNFSEEHSLYLNINWKVISVCS